MTESPLFRKHTPILLVDRIAPALGFWTGLGFQPVAEVPGPDGEPQFALLVRDGIEVMYQTWASVAAESAAASDAARGHSAALYFDVADLDAVDRMLAGVARVTGRHRTFYGTEEFSVREPCGTLVTFATRVEG